MSAKVIPFPSKQDSKAVVIIELQLGHVTEKKAQKLAEKLAEDLFIRTDDMPDLKLSYYVAMDVEVH
jgi:hypothetical protein